MLTGKSNTTMIVALMLFATGGMAAKWKGGVVRRETSVKSLVIDPSEDSKEAIALPRSGDSDLPNNAAGEMMQASCSDVWSMEKCKKQVDKGKCKKDNVRSNCQRTCGHCEALKFTGCRLCRRAPK